MVMVATLGVDGNITFIRFKNAHLINQKLMKKMHNTLNDTVLTNSYKLRFSDLGSSNFQFNSYSFDFV
jgi:hypothetical protein